MIIIIEGDSKDVAATVVRTRGSGAILLTSPDRRILNASRTVVSTGYDWGTTEDGGAVWDATNEEIYTRFGSTSSGLTTPGIYYVQLRGTIGTERYTKEIIVQVREIGPGP